MGYIRGLIHGAVIGAAVGVSIAPQEGARTREQIRAASEKVRSGVQTAQEAARRVAPQAREAAGTMGVVLDGLRQKVVHRGADEAEVPMSGSPVPGGTGVLAP